MAGRREGKPLGRCSPQSPRVTSRKEALKKQPEEGAESFRGALKPLGRRRGSLPLMDLPSLEVGAEEAPHFSFRNKNIKVQYRRHVPTPLPQHLLQTRAKKKPLAPFEQEEGGDRYSSAPAKCMASKAWKLENILLLKPLKQPSKNSPHC